MEWEWSGGGLISWLGCLVCLHRRRPWQFCGSSSPPSLPTTSWCDIILPCVAAAAVPQEITLYRLAEDEAQQQLLPYSVR